MELIHTWKKKALAPSVYKMETPARAAHSNHGQVRPWHPATCGSPQLSTPFSPPFSLTQLSQQVAKEAKQITDHRELCCAAKARCFRSRYIYREGFL